MKSDFLKKLAKQAKMRLLGESIVEDFYHIRTTKDNENEQFYQKVSNLLSENRDVINPFFYLIDKEKYQSLDKFAKEKYFLEIADKYLECKKRYEKENPICYA